MVNYFWYITKELGNVILGVLCNCIKELFSINQQKKKFKLAFFTHVQIV